MDHQEHSGERKRRMKKRWILAGALLLAAIVGTVAAVQLSAIKKAEGKKNPVAAEDHEAQDDVNERDIEKDGSNQGTVGFCVVYRKGWAALLGEGGLHLTKDGKEIWNDPGNHYWYLMLTDDGLFYVTGEGGSELNYYDFEQNKAIKLPVSRNYNMNLLAFVDGKVYLQVNQDGIENYSMEYKIVEFCVDDGEEREILLPDLKGNFISVFSNGKLYYLGGRSNNNTEPLYEADLENNSTRILDQSTAQALTTDGESIFYLHCEDDTFTGESMVQLIEMNTLNLQSRVLVEGFYKDVGSPVYADQRYLILYCKSDEEQYIKIYDRTTGQSRKVDSQGEEYLYFIQAEEKGIYFNACSDYVQDGVSYGVAPYHVFFYDYETQTAEEVGSTEEYAACVGDSQIYYLKWENHEEKCGSVPFGNVASHKEIPARIGDAKKAEYLLPDSDSRYYEESELERLTNGELRLARNEIYARHGYVFQEANLERHFSSKAWYTPSMEADQFDEAILNKYEKANLELILAYERKKGVNQRA